MEISIHALREEGDGGLTDELARPVYFYPRPPRGGRRTCLYEAGRDEDISIHALREEGDAAVVLEDYEETKFLSTPSARRATMYSARAPRTSRHFYPRPPRGGRPFVSLVDKADNKFLSTPSARRATSRARLFDGREDISIHALREEGDPAAQTCARKEMYFYPRPPRGGRRVTFSEVDKCSEISIHALREEGDFPKNAQKK